MKNIATLILASTLLVSCGDTTTTESKETTEAQETKTEITSEAKVKAEPETNHEIEYSILEQYAVFDTKDKLIAEFGAENLVDGTSWYGEGSLELEHSVLTNPKNSQIVKFVWDEIDPTQLSMLELNHEIRNNDFEIIGAQNVGTKSGIYVGMTLAELKEWYGEDVEFYGFGWDFGGAVVKNEGSKFNESGILFTLGIDYSVDTEKYNYISGDQTFSTSDAKIMEAPIFVSQILYFANHQD